METFQIFEVCRSHFSKSERFWPAFNLNKVIKSFCDVATLTWAFYDSVLKKIIYKI